MTDTPQRAFAGFGTFTGVFTPTLLTILGVIMYIRLGWVVGNAGLLGAFAVMGIAMGITAATGLSLSSIATNTRLGAGGPYAIISRSLGLEVGGSIGVPLYLSRPLGVAMYVFGFREGWLWFFPEHDPLIIDLSVFAALFTLAFLSANLAFKVQYVIMAVIAASLLSILFSPYTFDPVTTSPEWVGDFRGFPEHGFEGINFWVVFAIFFPATTGILAGANMSGDLADPRRAIPRGTLAAIAISSIIYFLLAWWTTRAATVDELATNYNIIIERALWPPAVLAGLLGATFSSALASAVGGPRILMAMGEHRIMPASGWLAATSRGEPRNAIIVTAVLTFACLMVRDLNAIAPLVTMFFLITYFMINLVLLIESSLSLPSFRPTLRVPRFVPLLGAIGCVFVMFIISPTFGVGAVTVSVAIYAYILKRGVESAVDDVRSGLFISLAEWAANRVTELGRRATARAWKPSLLVPIESVDQAMGEFHFLVDVCLPGGSVKLLGVTSLARRGELIEELLDLEDSFLHREVFCTSAVVDATTLERGTIIGLQALQSAFFRPNLLFLQLPSAQEDHRLPEVGKIIQQAHATGVGILLLGVHAKAGLGRGRALNLWVQASSYGWSAKKAFEKNNLDLILLMGYRLSHRWGADIRLVTVVRDADQVADAERFLREVGELARMPKGHTVHVLEGSFATARSKAPSADLHLLGLQDDPDFAFMRDTMRETRASCLFVADSGRESARA